jgi:hypothetical protein
LSSAKVVISPPSSRSALNALPFFLQQSLGEPDAFRLRYRGDIRVLVTEIVMNAQSQAMANQAVVAYATRLPEGDRAKFIEVVETELLSLHEGNIARYRIRSSAFSAWKKVWKGKAGN